MSNNGDWLYVLSCDEPSTAVKSGAKEENLLTWKCSQHIKGKK